MLNRAELLGRLFKKRWTLEVRSSSSKIVPPDVVVRIERLRELTFVPRSGPGSKRNRTSVQAFFQIFEISHPGPFLTTIESLSFPCETRTLFHMEDRWGLAILRSGSAGWSVSLTTHLLLCCVLWLDDGCGRGPLASPKVDWAHEVDRGRGGHGSSCSLRLCNVHIRLSRFSLFFSNLSHATILPDIFNFTT